MDTFNLEHNISSSDRSSMIDRAVKILDVDLEIVSSEGSILHANFYLISKTSPLLRSLFLFPTDKSAPARIHLPDVSKVGISHLINIVMQGFTTGQGAAISIRREIEEAARVLGFTEIPGLAYDDGREEEEMSSSSQTFDEETQEEGNTDTEDCLHDVNYSAKSSENDVEMIETRGKIAEIELKVVGWLKGLENMAKAGHLEGMKLLLALDGIEITKYEKLRKGRKSLVNRIQTALDMNASIQEIQKLTANGVNISKGNPLEDVNEKMANGYNNGIDVGKQTMSQNDESMEVTDRIEEKNKPEREDTSLKSKKLNIDDDLMINSEDSQEEDEVDSQDDMEQDPVIGQEKSNQSPYPQSSLKKCYVLLERSLNIPGIEKCFTLSKRTNERLDKVQTEKAKHKGSENPINNIQNVKPPMVSAAKRRRVIPEAEKNEIEIEEKKHNNCEVREAMPDVLKVEPAAGEDDNNGENGDIVQFPCGACKQVFSNASTILVHTEKHVGGKATSIRNCQFCTYPGNRTAMLQHLRTKHTREELFKCSSCEKRFATCKMLKSHVKKGH